LSNLDDITIGEMGSGEWLLLDNTIYNSDAF